MTWEPWQVDFFGAGLMAVKELHETGRPFKLPQGADGRLYKEYIEWRYDRFERPRKGFPSRLSPTRIFSNRSLDGLDEDEAVYVAEFERALMQVLLRRATPTRTRQDLILSALVVVYVCLAYVCLTTRPLPESLIEPLAGAFGYLLWEYDRATRQQ